MGEARLSRRRARIRDALQRLLPLLLAGVCWWVPRAYAAPATQIFYRDAEPGQPPYTSRILVQGERLRMDYGKDDDDFVLFDHRAGKVYVVSRTASRITEIPARLAKPGPDQIKTVHITTLNRDGQKIVRVSLKDKVCAEIKTAPVLPHEAELLRDLNLALSANQEASWDATPTEYKYDCDWVMDVQEAGVEYRYGFPIAIHYAGGRSRVYRSESTIEAAPGLFELPADYPRYLVDTGK
jgi:hypothetical protein